MKEDALAVLLLRMQRNTGSWQQQRQLLDGTPTLLPC
jgi:hypothetical protein